MWYHGTYRLCHDKVYTSHIVAHTTFLMSWHSLRYCTSIMKTLTPIQSAHTTLLPHPLSLPRYSMPTFFSPVLKDIISCLLQTDVTKRFGNLRRGADDIKSHEWFRSVNWLDVFNRRGTAPFRPPARGVANIGQHPSGDAATMMEVSNHDDFVDEFKDF